MRVTGGKFSGRILKAPSGRTTRPTNDRVREALFNILSHHDWGDDAVNPLENARVLDAFCGTGALAIEALSRGASHATFFDIDKQALLNAKENIAALNVKDICAIMMADAAHPPKAKEPCSLIFLDPPYRKNLVVESLAALDKAGWMAPKALIVAETAKGENLLLDRKFKPLLSRTYGDTEIHFIFYN